MLAVGYQTGASHPVDDIPSAGIERQLTGKSNSSLDDRNGAHFCLAPAGLTIVVGGFVVTDPNSDWFNGDARTGFGDFLTTGTEWG